MTPEFHYRANGLALAGEFPSENLGMLAAIVLPPIGGEGDAKVDTFASSTAEGASFDRARTSVWGRKLASGGYQTIVSVTISDLNLADGLVTARKIRAILNSDHPAPGEPTIVPFVAFEGLEIMGRPFAPRSQGVLFSQGRLSGLRALPDHPLVGPERESLALGSTLETAPAGSDWVMTSLFDQWREGDPGEAATGGACGLRIHGRGTLYFGDYLISDESRRLTVLRAELEGPFQGTVAAAYLETNGHWYP